MLQYEQTTRLRTQRSSMAAGSLHHNDCDRRQEKSPPLLRKDGAHENTKDARVLTIPRCSRQPAVAA